MITIEGGSSTYGENVTIQDTTGLTLKGADTGFGLPILTGDILFRGYNIGLTLDDLVISKGGTDYNIDFFHVNTFRGRHVLSWPTRSQAA